MYTWKNNNGQTPIFLASYNGHWNRSETIKCLINKGAQYDEKDILKQTPLHFGTLALT